MLLKIYALYDRKTEVYSDPVFSHSDGSVKRIIMDVLVKGDTMIARHPVDFDLYYIGSFNDGIGEVKGVVPIERICSLSELAQLLERNSPSHRIHEEENSE